MLAFKLNSTHWFSTCNAHLATYTRLVLKYLATLSRSAAVRLDPEGRHRPLSNKASETPLRNAGAFSNTG